MISSTSSYDLRMLDQETLIRDLARLRSVLRRRHDDDVAAVDDDLSRAAGPSVRRAAAARLLGVSQTALDRWIASGDVPVVVTSRGRREVPSDALVELVERIDSRRNEGAKHPLAEELQARRARAARIDPDRLLAGACDAGSPTRSGASSSATARSHRGAELRALAYHRAVAQSLDAGKVADARGRLRRWRHDGRIHPRYADAWAELLARPVREIAETISRDDEEARDLRQNSPFAGALDEPTRRRVLTVFDRAA